jgi:DNA-binding response OmpR family regulator
MQGHAQNTMAVGRRPAIPFEAIGARVRKRDQTPPDKCPCCGAALEAVKPRVDFNSNTLLVGDKVLKLRPKEVEVMSMLIEAFPRVVTTDRLIAGAWGHREPDSAYSCLKQYMWRLRNTLEGTSLSIANVMGTGWRLVLS